MSVKALCIGISFTKRECAGRFMPFSNGQMKSLREHYHVYVQDNGRISIA